MASFNCRISPRTSTVILRERSPLATAIVTSEMLRTCAVRLLAIELTLSVRSFQTPLTSRTCAWPPSLPSVPTSRATRVTSDVNTPSCSIIVLTIVAERRNSPSRGRPSTSSLTVWSRSPLATAASARVTSVVGQSRSSMSVLTDASMSPHAPLGCPNLTRCRVCPRLPTTVPTRSSSLAMRALEVTISLKVSAILPSRPVQSPGRRTEKSPSRTACSARSSSDNSVWDEVRADDEEETELSLRIARLPRKNGERKSWIESQGFRLSARIRLSLIDEITGDIADYDGDGEQPGGCHPCG